MKRLGRYEILREIGRGAMGTVHRARDPKIDREVAIKTINLQGLSPEEAQQYRERFFREAQAAGRLSHAGIVTIYDVGEDEATGLPFLVMEFIEGTTLEELVRSGRLPFEKALGLTKQVAEALDYAHARKIVHRDIKPANILVAPDGLAKIADFGVAKLQTLQFTQPGMVMGTPAYMAPEQLIGGPVDGRSDLFSLGTILYWLVTGQQPFTGDSLASLTYNVAHVPHRRPTEVVSGLSPDCDHVIDRALAKDPSRRFQSGREFASALENLQRSSTPGSQSAIPAGVSTGGPVVPKHTETQPLQPTVALAPPRKGLAPLWFRTAEVVRRLPRGVQLGVGIGILLLLLLAVLMGGTARQATLQVNVQHSFRQAELSVWVGDDLLYMGKLEGVVKKRLKILEDVEGSFSETVQVPAGNHIVRVRVRSPSEGFDQTKEIRGEFIQDGQKVLQISFGWRNNNLSLALY